MTTGSSAAPTLAQLPAPPPGKTGWPWTEASPPLPPRLPDGGEWPLVSIVTPSYNQGQFVEETIRSILLQGYPRLEYIVMDGGSSDATVEVIRRYEPWIAHWASERDRGQTHAINKGLALATGEIFAYLNSDDLFLPGALAAVARELASHPEADVVYGKCRYVDEKRAELFTLQARVTDFEGYLRIWDRFAAGDFMTQPEVFCRTRPVKDLGGFREDLRSVMDFDMWLRMLAAGCRFHPIDVTVSEFRCHASQTSGIDPGDELFALVSGYLDQPEWPLTDELRARYREELRGAHAHWLVRGAIAANGVGRYGHALRYLLRAIHSSPRLSLRYEPWAVLANPVKGWVPGSVRERLRRYVLSRRTASVTREVGK
jgi:glycosyltransferase involved in cell wall biosynthesis